MRYLLVLLLPLVHGLSCSACRGADAKPNIILILSDDQAWNDYGFMGHPHIETPNLDRLAQESLTYTRGYVSAPLCRPSLASIVTGLPCHRHGVTGNDPTTGDTTIRNMASRSYPRHNALHQTLYDRLAGQPNFVRTLKEAGYATLQTGKWWEADPKRYGFTHAMTHGDPARGARHGDEGLTISREGIKPIQRFLDEVTSGDEAKPFFIWHAPLLPHTPHNPPQELLAKYLAVAPSKPVAAYWAMCEWFDQTCGEVLNELDDRGLRESTVVIYLTDNGWIQHPSTANRYAPRSKQSSYEGGIRTPVMLRWPGKVKAETDTQTLVSAIDIAPTVLDIAGVKSAAPLPGIDLRDKAALRARNAVFGSAFPHDIPDVASPTVGWKSRYVIAGPWKLIVHSSSDANPELYDLTADPFEKKDLSQRHPDIVTRLSGQLDDWWDRSLAND